MYIDGGKDPTATFVPRYVKDPQSNLDPMLNLNEDGGGVRGLSSLLILEHLMYKINPESPPKPCEYFDLIGGTSTGG